MSKQYTTAAGTTNHMPTHAPTENGGKRQIVGMEAADFEKLWGCSITEVPDPTAEELAAEAHAAMIKRITPAIQTVAAAFLALWATTGLPAPADWTAAREALRPWVEEDAATRNVTLTELLSLRIELADAGGCWEQVLYIAGK